MNGQEDLQMIGVGGSSADSERQYAIEWDDKGVRFYINGGLVRWGPRDLYSAPSHGWERIAAARLLPPPQSRCLSNEALTVISQSSDALSQSDGTDC
jgi:hypothetical protein